MILIITLLYPKLPRNTFSSLALINHQTVKWRLLRFLVFRVFSNSSLCLIPSPQVSLKLTQRPEVPTLPDLKAHSFDSIPRWQIPLVSTTKVAERENVQWNSKKILESGLTLGLSKYRKLERKKRDRLSELDSEKFQNQA